MMHDSMTKCDTIRIASYQNLYLVFEWTPSTRREHDSRLPARLFAHCCMHARLNYQNNTCCRLPGKRPCHTGVIDKNLRHIVELKTTLMLLPIDFFTSTCYSYDTQYDLCRHILCTTICLTFEQSNVVQFFLNSSNLLVDTRSNRLEVCLLRFVVVS